MIIPTTELAPSPVSFRVLASLFVSLVFINGAPGQSCPPPEGNSEPVAFVAADDRGCRDKFNGRRCEFACEYRLTARSPVKTVRVVAQWMTTRTAPSTFDDLPCDRKSIAVYPNVHSQGKTYSEVDVYSFEPFDPATGVFRSIAEKLLVQIESRGLPCPPVPTSTPAIRPTPSPAGTPTPRPDPEHNDHASICRRNFSELNKLRFKSIEINSQLRYLNDALTNPTAVRDQLAILEQYVRAVGDPNYNGPFKDTLDRIRSSAPDRASFAAYYGIESDNDAATLIRRARQTTANRLEYQTNSAAIIDRLNIDKQLTEKEIARLRQDIVTRNCGSDQAGSCDVSGRWNFFAQGENVRDYWTLTPVSAGKYRARNDTGSREGDAEVFVNEVALNEMLLSWRNAGTLPSIFGGSFRVTLRKGCQDGSGERAISGVETRTAISAFRDASNLQVFVNNKNYDAMFEGQRYPSVFQRQMNGDIPIDVFFFRVLAPDGSQAVQDGQQLWGRFVRQPSVDHPDQSKVVWWAVTWSLVNRAWVKNERQVPLVEIRSQP